MESRSHSALANVLVGALVVVGATDVWSAIAFLHRASLVSGFNLADPASISLTDAQAADHQVRLSVGVGLLAIVITAVLFVTWLYQLYKTVHERRPGMASYGAGWAIGGWFVPVLNLVRPYQVAADAWQTSGEPPHDRSRPPSWFGWWWGIYIVHDVVFYIAVAEAPDFSVGGANQDRLVTFDRVSAAAHGLSIAAAVLAIMVVRALTPRVDAASPSLLATMSAPAMATSAPAGMVFVPAPGWPAPPAGWVPPPGWQPDPAWPVAPANWQFWQPSGG